MLVRLNWGNVDKDKLTVSILILRGLMIPVG